MATRVTKWLAENGKTYNTEYEALQADLITYKEKAAKWDAYEAKQKAESDDNQTRQPYHENADY